MSASRSELTYVHRSTPRTPNCARREETLPRRPGPGRRGGAARDGEIGTMRGRRGSTQLRAAGAGSRPGARPPVVVPPWRVRGEWRPARSSRRTRARGGGGGGCVPCERLTPARAGMAEWARTREAPAGLYSIGSPCRVTYRDRVTAVVLVKRQQLLHTRVCARVLAACRFSPYARVQCATWSRPSASNVAVARYFSNVTSSFLQQVLLPTKNR